MRKHDNSSLWFLMPLALLCAIIFGAPARAQYSAPSSGLDTYGGLIGTTCVNTNTAFSIVSTYTIVATSTVVNNRSVFCDPSGHVYFARGMATFDLNNPGSLDEYGSSYATYVLARYGSGQAWANADMALFKTWGLNALGPYLNTSYSFPWKTTSPVPFLAYANIGGYSVYNPQHYVDSLGCLPKDLVTTLKTNARWTWGIPDTLVDFADPCWASYEAAYMANDVAFSVGSQTAAMKHYVIAVGDVDSDDMHGFGSGPDFAANQGVVDFRLGYLGFFLPPVQYADSSNGQIYSVSAALFIKSTWQSILTSEYGNAAALDTAWGNGAAYTTLGTSGECVGPVPVSPCGSSTGAETAYTGTGSTCSFTGYSLVNTAVSKFSLGIFVGGVLAGGDTGAGALYGPNLSGSINYATGAFSPTFASGHCPGSGVAVTVAYIANGFGIGTGFMDEDCRSAHSSYCGAGNSSAAEFLTGLSPTTQADVNALTKAIASSYSSSSKTNVNNWASAHGFIGNVLDFGPFVFGTWGNIPDRFILQGISGNLDFVIEGGSGGSFSHWGQGMLDFVNTYAPNLPLVQTSYRTSNAQSIFSWANSSCTHSGTSVTCTVGSPSKFPNGFGPIDVGCLAPDYNVTQLSSTQWSSTSTTVTYTAPVTPSESSTTCNVRLDDNNEAGFATQLLRGQSFLADEGTALSLAYTVGGLRPVIGYFQWAWRDYWNEGLNWGFVTQKDDAYNGIDDANTSVTCAPPRQAFTCGPENPLHFASGATTLGDFTDLVGTANVAIDTTLLGGTGSTGCTVGPGIALGPGVVTNKFVIDVCKGRIEWSKPRYSHFSQSF